jgi:two-component system response regulator
MPQVRLLIIEDDPNDEALTLRALRAFGPSITVSVVRDGAHALRVLGLNGSEANSDLPEIIILDLKIPLIGGHEILKAVKAHDHTRQIEVVVLSSSDEDSDVSKSFELGAISHVRKPLEFDEYMSVVSDVIAKVLSEHAQSRPD